MGPSSPFLGSEHLQRVHRGCQVAQSLRKALSAVYVAVMRLKADKAHHVLSAVCAPMAGCFPAMLPAPHRSSDVISALI